MIQYINDFFKEDNTIIKTIKYTPDGKHKYAWNIHKTKYVKAIVIHHTHSEYTDSYDGMRQIYKYHAITREW
jgi:hypothetical protein